MKPTYGLHPTPRNLVQHVYIIHGNFNTFQTYDIGVGFRSRTSEILNPYNFRTWCPNNVLFSALGHFDLAKKKYHEIDSSNNRLFFGPENH